MKKILLAFVVLIAARLNAQIINGGFETWNQNTSYFAGYSGVVAADTFQYYDPQYWTSANAITGDTALGGRSLVTQSNSAHSGTSAIQLKTDTLSPVTAPVFGTVQFVVPGLILNGVFPVNGIISQSTLLAGGSISPATVPGAGQAFTQRLDSFSGYFQYTPVFNSFTNSMDTAVMWATLRKGTTIIANAEFKTQQTTTGYTRFSVPFKYISCEQPDTLVVLLASSIPVFSGIINGNTGLVPGSVLVVDDLSYDTLAADINFVFAQNDVDTIHRGATDTINVLANDNSCTGSNANITVSITTPPMHGTATVLSNNEISYASSSSYYGEDSLLYTDTDPSGPSSSAWVKIFVGFGVGISEANEVAVKMFPVPAANELHIQFANTGKTTARIYDVVGNLVSTISLTQNDNNINIANLGNGAYGLQLVDETNTVIARTKFVVSR